MAPSRTSPSRTDGGITLTDLAGIMLLPRATADTRRPSTPAFWVIFLPVILGVLVILGIGVAVWYFRKRKQQRFASSNLSLPLPGINANAYPPPPEGLQQRRGSWGIDSPPQVDPFPRPDVRPPPPAAFLPGAPASVSGSHSSNPSQRSHPSNPSNSHHSQSPPRSAASTSIYSPATPTAPGAYRPPGPLSPEPTGNAPAYRTPTPANSAMADDDAAPSIFDQQRRSYMGSAAGSRAPGAPGYTPSMMYAPTASSGPTRPSSPGSPRHAYRTFPDPYGPGGPGVIPGARALPEYEETEGSPTLAQRAHEFV